MKKTDVQIFRCPKCRGRLSLVPSGLGKEYLQGDELDELKEANLRCESCGMIFPLADSIPRFVDAKNYGFSFGYQWKKFAETQCSPAFQKMNRERFYGTTGWPSNLEGQTILEAGCGAGRFSPIVLAAGAELYSFDISRAVEACLENTQRLSGKNRHHLFQASLYEIPLPQGMFDKIFCMGVLQHCPDVKKAYLSLIPFLKPGGELVVDCYLSRPLKHAFSLKYWLRPFFHRWPPERLFSFLSWAMSVVCEIKWLVEKIPAAGKSIADRIPPKRFIDEPPEENLTRPEIKEIKTLNVFDMLSPRYDKCQSPETFRRWMKEAGLDRIEVTTGFNGVIARARRSKENLSARTGSAS